MRYPFANRAVRSAIAMSAVVVLNIASAQDQMKVGSISTHCASPLIVGVTRCGADEPAPPKPMPKDLPKRSQLTPPKSDAAVDPVIGGVKESEVNEYLANYGKPPKEAVRAILNPSDENISAMLKVERSQLAVVAYTAQRRTELTQSQLKSKDSGLSLADLPNLIGMRLVVMVSPDCRDCERVLPIVQQLVTEFPSVDARIGVLGLSDPKQFVLKTAALGVFLPSSRVSAERLRQLGISELPSIVVGDTRFNREAVLSEPVENALDLQRMTVQIRMENERLAKQDTSRTGK